MKDSDPGIAGLSVPDRNLSDPVPLLSLASLKDSDPGIAGLSVPDRNLSDPVPLLSLCSLSLSLSDSLSISLSLSLSLRSLSLSLSLLLLLLFLYFISLPLHSLASLKDSDPGIAGLSVPDRNLSDPIPLLSLASLEDSDPGIAGLSVPDRSPSDPIPLLSLSLYLTLAKVHASDTHTKRCNGKLEQGILTLYNHIDSVDDYTLAIRIGCVLLYS